MSFPHLDHLVNSAFHHGDGIQGLAGTPALSVDLFVISPPYGDLRTFGGHPYGEKEFRALSQELWRVTKRGGVVCWQEGDQMVRGSLTGNPFRHVLHFLDLGFRHYETLYTGILGGRPRGKHYVNPPQPVYVLSKENPKTFNPILKKNTYVGHTGGSIYRPTNGSISPKPRVPVHDYGIRDCWWYYPVAPHTEKPYSKLRHGATMHNHLARDLILSYSRPGDLVCDPLAGLATTGKWATLTGRSFLGWEIHSHYHQWGERRLRRARLDRLKFLLDQH